MGMAEKRRIRFHFTGSGNKPIVAIVQGITMSVAEKKPMSAAVNNSGLRYGSRIVVISPHHFPFAGKTRERRGTAQVFYAVTQKNCGVKRILAGPAQNRFKKWAVPVGVGENQKSLTFHNRDIIAYI